MKRFFFLLLITLPVISMFAQQRGFKHINIAINGSQTKLYNQSHALIIGMSNYTAGWPKLNGVKEDVPEVKKTLESNGFNVVVKMDLTKEQLDKAFIDFITTYGQNLENRLLFYFAGHGHTLNNFGEILGYIVPVDAPNPNYNETGFIAKAMPMSRVEEYAKQAKSKHALFLFDACFSGSLFATSRAVPEIISYKTTKPVRQFITSGSEDETVPDKSIFRQQFVSALTTDYADANKDGYLTGTELGKYLQDNVVNYSRNAQHPQYGKIRNQYLDKGDFVFVLKSNEVKNEGLLLAKESSWGDEEIVYTYGNIKIHTELTGTFYLDGEKKGVLNANTRKTLNNVLTGTHTYKIVGEETKTGTVEVQKNQTSYIEFKKQSPKGDFALNADFNVTVEGMNIAMRGIEGGTFTMGSNSNEADGKETPHTVTLGNFAMMKYEVTVAEFKKFIDATGYKTDADKVGKSIIWTGKFFEKKSGVNWKSDAVGNIRQINEYKHPVIHVSWNDAVAYAEWLSKKTGKKWRLPTEAEWEYAARGGQNYKYAGSINIDEVAWFEDNTNNNGTKPVGLKKPNGYGLYDMTGNVWEWCSDWFGKYSSQRQTNPKGPADGTVRVLRGGGWANDVKYCRLTYRSGSYGPSQVYGHIGFRLCMSVE